jgi:hypothetical protein
MVATIAFCHGCWLSTNRFDCLTKSAHVRTN